MTTDREAAEIYNISGSPFRKTKTMKPDKKVRNTAEMSDEYKNLTIRLNQNKFISEKQNTFEISNFTIDSSRPEV